jgi:predicted dehydrogenase
MNILDTPPVRWGIIGRGDVTKIKSGPAFLKPNRFELAGVMRRDFDKATNYARRHGVAKVFASQTSAETIDLSTYKFFYLR